MSHSRSLSCCSHPFQGLVNLEAEVAKCDKKIDLVRLNLEKLYKVISQPDYQVTVPEAVQLSNEEKVSTCLTFDKFHVGADWDCLQRKTLEVELAALQESRDMFAKLQ